MAKITKQARTLRIRKAKLDSSIARVKREIKSLTKRLRGRTRILSKRQALRARLA